MKTKEKVKIGLYITFRLLLIVALIYSIINQSWLNVLILILTLLFTFITPIVEKRLSINYPSEFEILILFFIFATLFLGEINYFYVRYWWWDIFLHSLSGIIVADLGFSLIYTLNRHKRIMTFLSPSFGALFVFSFSLAIAVLWEIFEFSVDILFGAHMQRGSLFDTMTDLILFTITAGIYTLIGYFYFKNQDNIKKLDSYLERMFNKSKILISN